MLAHEFLTMNRIPETLPISSLVCPPSQTFCKQYIAPGTGASKGAKDRFEYTAPMQTGIASARVYNIGGPGG